MLSQHMAFLVGNWTSSLPSMNTILSMGCSILSMGRSAIHSSTLRTNSFLSLLTSIILAIGQWFLEILLWYTTTIFPILKFFLLPSRFWCSCKDCRYFFFKQNQKSLAMSWIPCQPFLLYISGLENSPGSGETTFYFMVRMLTGDKGCRLVGSIRTSTVRGLRFKMPSTSVIIVNKDSLSRYSPCVFKSDPRMDLAERICRSQTPPIWLAKGGFLCDLIQSPPCSTRKDWIFLSSISIYAFLNSRSAPMKLLPLSE